MKVLKRSRGTRALMYIFAVVIVTACNTTISPEPTADYSMAMTPAVLLVTPTANPRSDTPTVAETTEPTNELSNTPTPVPSSTPSPTYTPDPRTPAADAALGSMWQGPEKGLEMVYVPGGIFIMGSEETDIDTFFYLL